MFGAVVSTTVIVRTTCGPCTSPVRVSVAVQETGVEPTGNVSPPLWSHTTLAPLSSVAVTLKFATAPAGDDASSVWSETGSKVGGSAPARETPKTSTPTRTAANAAQAAPNGPLPGANISLNDAA